MRKRTKKAVILAAVIISSLWIIKEGLPFFGSPSFVFAEISPEEEKKKLEKELAELEKQIQEYENDITKTQAEKNTLQNKIYTLRQKIKQLDAQINQTKLVIKDLDFQIDDTQGSIEQVSSEIQLAKIQLRDLLRVVYENDQYSDVEILLAGENLSDFFDNLVFLSSLNEKNNEILSHIENLKATLVSQEEALSGEKDEKENLVKMQLLQKTESEKATKQHENLLAETKGQESEYQKLLEQTKAKAQKIRQRIFELVGVPEAPTFGEAYEIAKYVESVTGVRPAFLLAILAQESSIGKNVGQCFLSNKETGAGVIASTGQKVDAVMKPTRDVAPFLVVCKELSRDPYATRVSCPMSFGYGGAMGPAQFIPSTWIIYKDRVKAITGKPADPWSIKDAFLAAALYLGDYGAKSQTDDGEWKAAMIYFSGSTNTKYRFYGDSVINTAAGFADDIKALEQAAAN